MTLCVCVYGALATECESVCVCVIFLLFLLSYFPVNINLDTQK